MSELAETFMQRCLAGDVVFDDIDEAVENWHRGESAQTLQDHLGMTSPEYDLWLVNPSSLPLIVSCRRSGIPLREEVSGLV